MLRTIVGLVCLPAWLYGMFAAFVTAQWLWLAVGFFVPPVGVVYGFIDLLS